MATPLAGRKLMLVEDDDVVAHEVVRAFEEDGAIVLGPAASVHDALALIGQHARLDGLVQRGGA